MHVVIFLSHDNRVTTLDFDDCISDRKEQMRVCVCVSELFFGCCGGGGGGGGKRWTGGEGRYDMYIRSEDFVPPSRLVDYSSWISRILKWIISERDDTTGYLWAVNKRGVGLVKCGNLDGAEMN